MDEKAERVQSLADKLQAKHGDTVNKIQYKLWAEALDVKKHDSMERPPPGTIWGGTPKETRRTSVGQATSEAMSEAFTNMATSLASAFGQGNQLHQLLLQIDAKVLQLRCMGVSPGWLAHLQGKFLVSLSSYTSYLNVVHYNWGAV